MPDELIGVFGGTGLYQMPGLQVTSEDRLETPFGEPSDAFVRGELHGRSVVFLPRHGRRHHLLPTEINYRANVFGMKMLGVTHLISVSAVGSMKEAYEPGDVVLPDQFFDRTRNRPSTFFGNGVVAHVSLADPVCPSLSEQAAAALTLIGARLHRGGTYLCMEGPQFSTRAESLTYRGWGVDVIGMTNLQEAKLAREAELCYACLAMVTDYDCWKEGEEAVSGESVMAVLANNGRTAQAAIEAILRDFDSSKHGACTCRDALRAALITDLASVDAETLEVLGPLLTRYRA